MGFTLCYASPLFGGDREPSLGELFHAPRPQRREGAVVVPPGTRRTDIWSGRDTGVWSLWEG